MVLKVTYLVVRGNISTITQKRTASTSVANASNRQSMVVTLNTESTKYRPAAGAAVTSKVPTANRF